MQTTSAGTPRTFIEDHRGWLALFGGRGLLAVLLFAAAVELWLLAGVRAGQARPQAAMALALGGAAYWTFTEYALHRWLYHFRPRGPRLRRLVESFHVYHHRTPGDRAVWNAGPALVLGLLLLLSLPPLLLLRDLAATAGVMAGAVPAYALYEIAHHECHARAYRRGPMAWLQAFHLHHHQRDGRRNFGVTSPLWDWVFRTLARDGGR
jgi:sterol desaturase/sphingolipid hydroxylase (fatty acid hydroxylase superfamily)